MGKLSQFNNAKRTKAYCEGRVAAANGDLITVNPHIGTSDSVAKSDWDAGHDSWADDPANVSPADMNCCGRAYPYGGGFVQVRSTPAPAPAPAVDVASTLTASTTKPRKSKSKSKMHP